MERGLEILRDTGVSAGLSWHYVFVSEVYLDLGDKENARTCIEEALELAKKNNQKSAEGISLALLGKILGKADISRSSKAEEYILQGIKMSDELKLKPWTSRGNLYLGELYADTGQKEKALETLKETEAAFQEMGMDYWLRRTQEVLERVES